MDHSHDIAGRMFIDNDHVTRLDECFLDRTADSHRVPRHGIFPVGPRSLVGRVVHVDSHRSEVEWRFGNGTHRRRFVNAGTTRGQGEKRGNDEQ